MVCLNCGKQFFYSFDKMRRLSDREVRRMRAVRNTAPPLPAERPPVATLPGDNQAA